MDAFETGELVPAQDRPGEHTYVDFFRKEMLSLGMSVWPGGGEDTQQPHTEDEVDVVVAGRGTSPAAAPHRGRGLRREGRARADPGRGRGPAGEAWLGRLRRGGRRAPVPLGRRGPPGARLLGAAVRLARRARRRPRRGGGALTAVALPELDLADFRRRVNALYARVRAEPDPARAFAVWVAERDDLFARHPQSALPPERRAGFAGLSFSPTPPAARVLAEVAPAERRHYEVPSSDGATMAFERVGVARF